MCKRKFAHFELNTFSDHIYLLTKCRKQWVWIIGQCTLQILTRIKKIRVHVYSVHSIIILCKACILTFCLIILSALYAKRTY